MTARLGFGAVGDRDRAVRLRIGSPDVHNRGAAARSDGGRAVKDLVLTLRAFRWRRGGSIVVLVVAALTVAAAAIGPLYAGSAAESVLQDRLRQGTAGQTTIAFSADADVSYPGSIDVVSQPEAERGTLPGYGPLVNEASVATGVAAPGGLGAMTNVVWRDGACGHLVITSGTCATSVGGAVVSERAAESMGWKIGTVLEFDALRKYDTNIPGPDIATVPLSLRIVGLYRPRSTVDPFWAGRLYFAFHPYIVPGEDGPSTVESVFVSHDVFPTLVNPTPGTISADLLLVDPSAIRVADVPRLRDAVSSYLGSDTTGPQRKTGLLDLLDSFETERSQTALASAVVSVQLALLALLLLSLVITDTSEARGGEVALAKLRGLRPRAVAAVALREPVLLLLLAIPLGLALAYAGAVILARAVLVPGVPVELTPQTWVAVAVAFLGGLVAAVLASRRMFTRPVLEQWSSSDAPPRPRSGIVIDIALALLALAGFVALGRATQGTQGNSALRALGWAAPGLLVIAFALLLVRLAPPLLSRLVPLTRASRYIGLFLALRQVVRRPSGLRLAALLAVTIGLATFAVDAQAAAAQSREVRAGSDVGAVTSVSVQPGGKVDLQQAVNSVDPSGRWAMVVADWIPYGGSVTGRMLGVDSSRLATVGLWSPDYGAGSADHVAALIAPPLPPPLPLSGPIVRVRITSGPVSGPAPTVLIGLRDKLGHPFTAVSTTLEAGTHDYDATTACPGTGCVFYGVALNRALAFSSSHLDVLVTAVAEGEGTTFTPVPAPLHQADLWRVGAFSGVPVGTLSASSAGLHYVGIAPSSASPFIEYADTPAPLPMITTPPSLRALPGGGPPSVNDVYGHTIPVESVGSATVLPVVGDSGVMVDLTALRRSAEGLADDAHWSVWLGADAPPDAVQRLTRAGILVDSVTTAAERQAVLDREGPALALRLLLVCALIGALLSASAVAISVAVTGRRRSYELAALRAVAVRRTSLVRACVLEQLLLLGIGLVVGVPTGLVVARLALPTLPQTSSPTSLPLTLDVQTLAVSTFVVVTAVLLVTTAVVAGLTLVHQAVPDRLREVAQ
jgi:hypothetical protein